MLQQLRAGYPGRPARFPQSVVLCGLRDVRDYRMGATGSPFNIAAASLRLGDFSRAETLALLGQHTEATGQEFAPEALEAVWTQTCGQPWLVNALAYGACFKNKALRDDRSRPVTAAAVAAVREELIVERVTHLDYLADKLREERVRRVIEPMLSGGERRAVSDRDVEYARDLGLLAREAAGAHRQSDLRGGAATRPVVGSTGRRLTQETAPFREAPTAALNVDAAAGGVPELLPAPLRALARPLRLRGGVAAVAAAGLPAAGGERRRAHRAGVRAGPRAGRPADRMAGGGAAAERNGCRR